MHHFSDTATGKYIQNISDDKLAHHNQLPTKNIQILVLDTSYCQYIQVKCWLLGKLCTIDEVNRRLWNLGWSALEEVCEWFLRRGHLELQLHKEYKNRGSQSGVWGCPGLVLQIKKISSVCSGGRGDTPLPHKVSSLLWSCVAVTVFTLY